MERRRLGDTDIELTVIGLGTWQWGGRWGGADDADSLAAAHAAVDAGMNWIDTADIYGQGRAEEVLAPFLKERGDEVVLSTKGGVAWSYEPQFRIWRAADGAYLRGALEASLGRLGVEAVDIYHVHWPIAAGDPADTIGTLLDLKREGKIRAVAVSNYSTADLEATEGAGSIDAYQAGYHFMRREIEGGQLDWCGRNGVGVLAYGPLAHGLLTGSMGPETTFRDDDWRATSELFTDDAFADRLTVVDELGEIARQSGRAGGVAELAVAWVLRRPEVTSAIIGGRNAQQARGAAAYGARPLARDEEEAMEAVLARHPGADRHYSHGEPPDPTAEAA